MTSQHHHLPTPAGRHWRLFIVVLGVLVGAVAVAESPEPNKPPANDSRRFTFDKDRQYLRRVRDFQPLRIGGPDLQDGNEKEPFEDLVLHANGFTQDELLAAARKDVSYGHMMTQNELSREEVRFELVRVEGKLKRLSRMGSPARLRENGIPELYEAWIFPTQGRQTDPLCVILSEPPEGVEPAVDITPAVPVVTTGYFFKIVEYPSNEPNPDDKTRTLYRRAPLLVGRSAVADREAAPAPSSVTSLVTVSLVVGGVVLVGLLAMTYLLRKSDAGTRQVNQLRRRNPYTAQEPPGGPTQPPPPEPPTG